MYKFLQYALLFVVTVLLQTLLFDNLLLSPYIVPLFYVIFIILLPVSTSWSVSLLAGFLLGVVIDFTMGTAGINTIATTFVAFVRPAVINIVMGKDVQHETIPYGGSIDVREFLIYAGMMVFLHEALFFGFESLGSHFLLTLLKTVLSSAVTLLLIWLSAALFRKASR